MCCPEIPQVWKPISNKEELFGELGVRRPGLMSILGIKYSLLLLMVLLQENFDLKHYSICFEISIKRTLTPKRHVYKRM